MNYHTWTYHNRLQNISAGVEAQKWAKQRMKRLESECAKAISKEHEQRLHNLQRLRSVGDRVNREVQQMLTTRWGVSSISWT